MAQQVEVPTFIRGTLRFRLHWISQRNSLFRTNQEDLSSKPELGHIRKNHIRGRDPHNPAYQLQHWEFLLHCYQMVCKGVLALTAEQR
jgi:hypothetical protein